MRYPSPRWTAPVLLCIFLSFCILIPPASATIHNVKTGCGAVGNGSNDDTAAINTCIGRLANGDTLLFPAGTYKVSAQLTVNVAGVTIDGSSNTATILNTGSQQIGFLIGRNGIGNTNAALGTKVALSATANEGATNFTTASGLGVSVGGYVYLQQGGAGSSNGSGNTGCDPSGCRGEVLKVASVSGNTITVTTPLRDTFNPSVNGATAQNITGMLSGVTVQNITFDGNGGPNAGITYGLEANDLADSLITGVTSKNVQGAAIVASVGFNTSFNNITVTKAGSAACGGAVSINLQGNLSINSMSLSSLNPGAPNSGCLNNGAFGFEFLGGVSNPTVTDLTVDAAGTGGGRPMKITGARYGTFNSLTVKNGCCAYNGLSLEYYSSHNTFTGCVIQDNAAGSGSGGAGINSFGNFNQYNVFSGCTIARNGNQQVAISNHPYAGPQDINTIVQNSTITGIVGTASYGINIMSPSACINNNTFTGSTSLNPGISASYSSDIGSGNTMNGASSNLPSGTCQSSGSGGAPTPPSELTATVQ